jgi:hypothetical protein
LINVVSESEVPPVHSGNVPGDSGNWGATAQGDNELTKGGSSDTDYVSLSQYGRSVLVVLG